MLTRTLKSLGCVLLLLGTLSAARAEDAITAKAVVTGLDSPWAVAIQPSSFDVFVSESGAGRIVRFPAGENGSEAKPAITDFAVHDYGNNPPYKAGPLGLSFWNKEVLFVGGGEAGVGADMIRIYDVPERDKSIPATKIKDFGDTKWKGQVDPVVKSEATKTGEGMYHSLIASGNNKTLYALGQGDPDKGWILTAPISDAKTGPLATTIATKQFLPSGQPSAIAFTPDKRSNAGQLLIASRSEPDRPHSATVTFYNPRAKAEHPVLLQVKTGLNEIVGIAYSKSGNLYVLDFSSREPDQGGLYRLDDDYQGGVKAVKIVALDRPTSMAFVPDGSALFVTILGKFSSEAADKPGQVIKLKGNL